MKRLLIAVWCLIASASIAFAQGNYAVQVGDQLQIEVLEDDTLNRSVLVTPDGRIVFPFAGSVQAAGRTLEQIRRSITAGIQSQFAAEPNVFVSVAMLAPEMEPAEPETINVYFLGEVNTPGLVPVVPGTTFLQGLSQAGGFTSFAATKRVQLRRTSRRTGQQTVTIVDFNALSSGAVLNQSIVLTEGDVILIPERKLFE